MQTPVRIIALVSLAAFTAAGCGRKKAESAPPPDAPAAPVVGAELGAALEAMGQAAALAEAAPVEAVDFRKLRDLLPDSVGELARTRAEGQKQMGISMAEAHFADEEGDSTVRIAITDTGAMRGTLAAGAAFMLNIDMDRETDDGFERTTTLHGFKAYEKRNGDSGEIKILVADRFLVDVTGRSPRPDLFRLAVAAVPLRKLEALQNEGVQPAPEGTR